MDNNCPECQTTIPSDSPNGLCPVCLLENAYSVEGDSSLESSDIRPGSTFGKFVIRKLLGQGGMGKVFEAEEMDTGRLVALKVLTHKFPNSDIRNRFLQEGRIAASINHPRSVYIYGADEIDGIPVIIMELVGGGTLADKVQKEGPLGIHQAIDSIIQIIDGLDAAYQKGILHRDIKPSNCFLETDGSVKIGDFGISISSMPRWERDITKTGTFLGTPAYASPEQLRGDQLDIRSDVYSIAGTLYYLLTGKTVFNDSNVVNLISKVLSDKPTSPQELRANVPPQLNKLIMQCLSKAPGKRCSSYAELREALLPFSSYVEKPSKIITRAFSYIIDCMILIFLTIPVESSGDLTTYKSLFVYWGVAALYFSILEGKFNTPGKFILNLNVVGDKGGKPGITNAFWRYFILSLPVYLSTTFLYVIHDLMHPGMEYDDNDAFTIIELFWPLVIYGIYFWNARAGNQYRALHDILSKTRVVQSKEIKNAIPHVESDLVFEENDKSQEIGPYKVISDISHGPLKLLLAYDPLLLRSVWISIDPQDNTKADFEYNKNYRPGNLRWMNGSSIDGNEAWNAWEAPEGKPLVNILNGKQTWADVREWINDIINEHMAAKETDAPYSFLSIDQIWITEKGDAKVLPFQAPGIRGSERSFRKHDEVQNLLKEILSDAGIESGKPLPLHAKAFVEKLANYRHIKSLRESLEKIISKPATVSRSKLFSIVSIPSFLSISAVSIFLFTILLVFKFDLYEDISVDAQKVAYAMVIYNSLEFDYNDDFDQELKEAMEIYITGSFKEKAERWKADDNSPDLQFLDFFDVKETFIKIINETSIENQQVYQDSFNTLEDFFGENFFNEVLSLEKGFEKAFEEYTENPAVIPIYLLFFFSLCYLLIVAIPALISSLIFRQGILFHAFDVAIVNRSGQNAGRIRRTFRSLVAFTPILIVTIVMIKNIAVLDDEGYKFEYFDMLITSSCLMVYVAHAFYTLLTGKRSLQDRLAGTFLVAK